MARVADSPGNSGFADPASWYAALASLVDAGEWTTYGDISIAAHGTIGHARHVGRAAAAAVPGIPNAERVLASGGRIAAGWRSGDGYGPGECRRRLEAQGLVFAGGRADPGRHVDWEELLARADAAGIPRAGVIGDAGAARMQRLWRAGRQGAHRRGGSPRREGPETL